MVVSFMLSHICLLVLHLGIGSTDCGQFRYSRLGLSTPIHCRYEKLMMFEIVFLISLPFKHNIKHTIGKIKGKGL